MARNKYIRFVLLELGSVAYAYGSPEIRGDSNEGQIEEVLDVVAASAGWYMRGSWRVIRGDDGSVAGLVHTGTSEGDDPENHAGAWFLAGSSRFTDTEKARYAALWEKARPDVVLKERHAGH